MATATAPSQPELLAQYANASTATPSEPFTFTTPLPSLPSASDSAPPTAYLRAVRAAITTTQAQINEALTSRMEEDKARDAAAAVGTETGADGGKTGKSNKRKKAKIEVDEEAEEMNYGEEVVEED